MLGTGQLRGGTCVRTGRDKVGARVHGEGLRGGTCVHTGWTGWVPVYPGVGCTT